jgi:uncharacterized protein YcbX
MEITLTTSASDHVAAVAPGRLSIAELWRYPVKSLGGEQLHEAGLRRDGIAGDRAVQVRSRVSRFPELDGQTVTSRSRPRLLGLLADESEERFDILPLSVLTDGAVAALDVDRRRLRPNILIGGVEGLAERAWEGRRLRIGDGGDPGKGATIELVRLRGRCVMTTFDPDTLEQDHGVLRRIVSEFGGTMSLDTRIVRPGLIRVDDPVELLD